MKKSLVSLALVLGPLNPAFAVNGILDGVMATINKDAKIEGPIYRHERRNIERYGDELATIILQEAHKRAKRFLDEGNTQAYNTFLALALTVPVQEGLLVHFREVPADRKYCNDERSMGDEIASDRAKEQFKDTLVKDSDKGFFGSLFGKKDEQEKGFLVKCSSLRDQDHYRQLIVGGSDGSDVGIMQVSALWHYDEYLKPAKYESVRESVAYGLQYIHGQYKRIVRSYGSYGCFAKQNGDADFLKMARGSWSAYNGGPSQKCRFDDPSNPHAPKDEGFKSNLDKTMALNNGGFFGFNREGKLDLSPAVEAALSEVASNVENGTNSRRYLSAVIGQ